MNATAHTETASKATEFLRKPGARVMRYGAAGICLGIAGLVVTLIATFANPNATDNPLVLLLALTFAAVGLLGGPVAVVVGAVMLFVNRTR